MAATDRFPLFDAHLHIVDPQFPLIRNSGCRPEAFSTDDYLARNPDALMFGTDLPSTRAPRSYLDDDFLLVADTLGEEGARKVFHDNASAFHRLAERVDAVSEAVS